ncbi:MULTISPECIES: succinic semialdehyde dehydrogenase [Salinibaculum]|uniref:succinic semialdehyde dehydrogenase n=1 Tax=Salinibaculum TaxID=2732368 RepID=UPI0030CAAAAE
MTADPPAGYDGPSLDTLAADVDTGTAETLNVTAPFTGEAVGEVPACTPDNLRRAVERAREAQEPWAGRPVSERVAAVERFRSLVRERQADLLDLVQLESGKARLDAMEEVLDVQLTAGHYADKAPEYLAPERRTGVVPGLTRVREHRDPYGVAGFVTPWNYPLTLSVSDALPALLAGNAVVVKPAEATPYTALFAAELLREAGVPNELVQVVTGDGERLGPALVEAVDHVSFTGSTAVGREVAARAGRELTPVSLELGGKGPMVVRADAPLDRTVTGAVRGAFASAGQLCIAVERIYVHDSRYDDFCERLVGRTRALEVGTRFDYGPDVGSLVSERQLEKVATHVEEAVDAGATVLTGGRRRPDVAPFAYEPTVLTDVPDSASVACEETFGPVVTVEAVPDDDAAVERANDSTYGLHGTVWTDDTAAGRDVARRMDCGTVAVNDAHVAMWGSIDAPMGGRKESGIGRRHGDEGFEKYTQSQSVTVQGGHPIAPPPGVPNRLVAGGLSAYLRVMQRLGLR